MGTPLKQLTIRGFKSIQHLDGLALSNLTVLIGANGSGKSNFVDFFRLLRAMADGGLQSFVQISGGADGFFYLGPKATPQIEAQLEFGTNVYEFDLAAGANSNLFLSDERVQYTGGEGWGKLRSLGQGNLESTLRLKKDDTATYGQGPGVAHYVFEAISNWMVYHFHDTSRLAKVRRDQPLRDKGTLRAEADNIAPFLLNLRETEKARYDFLRDTIRLIAPFFDDFLLRPERNGEREVVRLEWRQKGSDFPFQPSQFSDGTLRFICLATALQQPSPPATIVIDEPELGLHPYALTVLANLIEVAAQQTQVIVATQSPMLLDHFEPESVLVVGRSNGQSTFSRLDSDTLKDWLSEYSMGELWRKSVVQAGPTHE